MIPPADTTDLRTGAPIQDDLLALLPLVGVWEGTGAGAVASSAAEFRFGQRLTFSHDGRPFLAYDSRAWLLDAEGGVIRNALRETGFWRPGAGPDDIEALLVTITGVSLSFVGRAGDLRWDLASAAVATAPTARDVAGERRLYAVVEDSLVYATELAVTPEEYTPHLNATLHRVRA